MPAAPVLICAFVLALIGALLPLHDKQIPHWGRQQHEFTLGENV